MSETVTATVICTYVPMFFAVVMIRWLEWDDSNLLRLFLFGLASPVVIAVMVVRVVNRYVRHRLPLELAELLPPRTDRRLPPPLPRENGEYVTGQWRG